MMRRLFLTSVCILSALPAVGCATTKPADPPIDDVSKRIENAIVETNGPLKKMVTLQIQCSIGAHHVHLTCTTLCTSRALAYTKIVLAGHLMRLLIEHKQCAMVSSSYHVWAECPGSAQTEAPERPSSANGFSSSSPVQRGPPLFDRIRHLIGITNCVKIVQRPDRERPKENVRAAICRNILLWTDPESGLASARLNASQRFAFADPAKRGNCRDLILAGPRGTGLPIVDRLLGDTEQGAKGTGRQVEPPPQLL